MIKEKSLYLTIRVSMSTRTRLDTQRPTTETFTVKVRYNLSNREVPNKGKEEVVVNLFRIFHKDNNTDEPFLVIGILLDTHPYISTSFSQLHTNKK